MDHGGAVVGALKTEVHYGPAGRDIAVELRIEICSHVDESADGFQAPGGTRLE